MQTGSYIRKYYCICIACNIKASHITKKHAFLNTATPKFANEYTRWQKSKPGCFKGSVVALAISLVGDGSGAPSGRYHRPFQQEWEELPQLTLRPRSGAITADGLFSGSFSNLLFSTSSSVHRLPHPASTLGGFYPVPHRKLLVSRSSRPTMVSLC